MVDGAYDLAIMAEHGGYPDPVHCPTHHQRRCPVWVEAWVAYEKAQDDLRAARGERRLYKWAPSGRSFG